MNQKFFFGSNWNMLKIDNKIVERMMKEVRKQHLKEFYLKVPKFDYVYLILFCLTVSSPLSNELSRFLGNLQSNANANISYCLQKNSERKMFNVVTELTNLSRILNSLQDMYAPQCSMRFNNTQFKQQIQDYVLRRLATKIERVWDKEAKNHIIVVKFGQQVHNQTLIIAQHQQYTIIAAFENQENSSIKFNSIISKNSESSFITFSQQEQQENQESESEKQEQEKEELEKQEQEKQQQEKQEVQQEEEQEEKQMKVQVKKRSRSHIQPSNNIQINTILIMSLILVIVLTIQLLDESGIAVGKFLSYFIPYGSSLEFIINIRLHLKKYLHSVVESI